MDLPSASALVAEVGDVPADVPRMAGSFDGDQVLVPLLTPTVPAVTDQLRAAASLARTSGATLHVVVPTATPELTSRTYGPELTLADERDLLEWAVETVSSPGSGIGELSSTHRLVNGISSTIERHDIDTLVVPSDSSTGLLSQGVTERLALRAECDVITVNGRYGYERVPSILLAVAGGPHSGLATDVARRIAVDFDAWVDVLHVVDEDPPDHRRRRAEAHVEAACERIGRPESTTTWILEAADVAEAIIEQSGYYGLTVVGAPTKGRLRQFIAGSTNRTIRDNARSVVVSARNNDSQ
jgi:nucleotide-binding universal stress UspA family protein